MGLLLRSDVPRFADFDLSPGAIHSGSSGCWLQWENRCGKRGVEAIKSPHIGESGYRAGYLPEQPARDRRLSLHDGRQGLSPDYAWVGLWNEEDASARSRVVAFNDQRRKVLTTLPFRLGGLSALPSPDTPALGLTIVGEGKDRGPVPYFQLLWMPGIREDADTVGDRP